MKAERQPLLEPNAIRILERYRIPYPTHGLAQNASEAVRLAEQIGYPVVLKIVSHAAVHKSDIGGVKTDLKDAGMVVQAFDQIIDNLQTHHQDAGNEGVLVVQQAPQGLEVMIGALDDATFGPTLMFGLGGIFAEVLKDVSFRIAPLSHQDAADMVREIKGYPLLTGLRGHAPLDHQAIIDLLLSVSRLVMENPQIKELDLNPVRVYETGLQVLDARMIVDPSK